MFQSPAIRQSCLELDKIDIIDSKEDMNISIQLPGGRYIAPMIFLSKLISLSSIKTDSRSSLSNTDRVS